MSLIPQYVKRGASGKLRHSTPKFQAPPQRFDVRKALDAIQAKMKVLGSGIRKVFAVCVGFGKFVFFVIFCVGLYACCVALAQGVA